MAKHAAIQSVSTHFGTVIEEGVTIWSCEHRDHTREEAYTCAQEALHHYREVSRFPHGKVFRS
jgi:hypothetical protein